VRPERLGEPEQRFPLEVAFCSDCTLVQILEEVSPEQLFVENYLYFSSFSDFLIAHARKHSDRLIEERELGPNSLVVELASNDGYLLKNFVERGVPVLGIDPAPDQAEAANAAGIRTIPAFFGAAMARRLREEGLVADVIVANNVLAHVPDLNGFVEGMATLLSDDGIITVENPYVRDLIDRCEFDTIYHEHYSYYSCTSIDGLVRRHGLRLNHVEYFPHLHGGTLRWHIGRSEHRSDEALRYLMQERDIGLDRMDYYSAFGERVDRVRRDLRDLLEGLKADGRTLAGYGAAAKGSTLLNFAGIGTDLVEYVVDRNAHKQGRYMPGTNQPVLAPEVLLERRPDFVLLLAWNFADEIIDQQREFLEGGGRFIVPVPNPVVIGA
jgi:SAM-dependent methyltransferase